MPWLDRMGTRELMFLVYTEANSDVWQRWYFVG